MSEDNIEKLFVKVFTADNSAKSLLADDRMSVSVICRQLAEKNHIVMDPKCSIVEHIPDLYLERFYEDNESLVENVLLWTKDSSNRLYFMEKEEKYDLFVNPERYLLDSHSSERHHQLDDEAKTNLVDEFFTGGHPVPEVEGFLYLKSDGKKAWKKHFFVLRASGLYYSLKGKSKSSKDLVCLTTFEMNNIYYGFGWRKKYKAPNEFGFAIKHPQIQAKNSKYIKYLCAESELELRLWTTGIRIAKYGRQLKDNYDNITRDIVEADLDSLADRRSFSVCSMAKTTTQVSPSSPVNSCASVSDSLPASEGYPASEGQCSSNSDGSPANSDDQHRAVRPKSITITSNYGNNNNNWHPMSRHDSIRSSSTSSSSGFLSERDSTISTPTKEQLAFEADFPVGTIKRKPSVMQPKIPLTSTTRNLALQSDDALLEVNSSDSDDDDCAQHYGTLKSGTMRRSATDDRLSARIYEPLREHRFQNINNNSINNNIGLNESSVQFVQCFNQSVVDELPLPPPPPVLQASLSTLSLNSLPPPPAEVLESPDLDDTLTPTAMSPVVSPKKSPQSPQVPPKPKLFRQMSETATDRNNFVNELKNRSNTLQRGFNSRPKVSFDESCSINGFVTSPRMRAGHYVQAMNNGSSINSNYSYYQPIPQQFLEQRHFQRQPQQQPQSPQQPVPQMQIYSNQQSIYGPNGFQNQQFVNNSQTYTKSKIYSVPPIEPSLRSPMKGPLPPPPEAFLNEIQRVMEKKWKVAQTLSTALSSTPNQILGFRDPIYLPPKSDPNYSNNVYDVLPKMLRSPDFGPNPSVMSPMISPKKVGLQSSAKVPPKPPVRRYFKDQNNSPNGIQRGVILAVNQYYN